MTHETTSFVELRFGEDQHWQLPNRETLASFTTDISPVEDLPRTVAAALAGPFGLPSLEQAIVPGDRVALAVDPSLPSLGDVVGLVVTWLLERGTEPSSLVAVLAGQDPMQLQQLKWGLGNALGKLGLDGDAVAVEMHDPDDPQAVAYVAANEQSDPIYINRTLVDADVVLPVCCARHAATFDYFGAYSLFPLLSNRETQGEFFRLARLEESDAHAGLIAWADQAAWWLGLLAIIQVVPASHDGVAGVFAGLMEPVEAASQELCERLWKAELAPNELVVALVDGSPSQHSWREVMRGLRAATRFVKQGGAIVVCSELAGGGGRSLKRLSDVHASRDAIARKLERDTSDDALPAAVVLEATADYHVYLVSGLARSVVENMGMGAIDSETQLAHLIGQHQSWSILGSAQHRF
jgi:hypothetical protein